MSTPLKRHTRPAQLFVSRNPHMQHFRIIKQWYTEDGYAALLGVLVIGAVTALATVSILLSGMQSSRTSFAFQQSAQAQSLADACAEEALQVIRDEVSYIGSDSLSFETGSCNYTVSFRNGQNRAITAEGFVGSMVRKIEIKISQINPEITVDSWQEVADF